MRLLLPEEYEAFIATIAHPFGTTICSHRLRHNMADVYIIGEPENFSAAIVQAHNDKAEPIGFGKDAAAYWEILRNLSDWEVIEVPLNIVPELSKIMEYGISLPIKHYQDIFYQLDSPVNTLVPNEEIEFRLLNEADIAIMQASIPECQSHNFGNIEASLKYGIIAGAIVARKLVAIADCFLTDKYGEIGVFTEENWRNKNLAASCVSLVAAKMQELGIIPHWSTGEANYASQALAKKLGFQEIGRMVYLIPEPNYYP